MLNGTNISKISQTIELHYYYYFCFAFFIEWLVVNTDIKAIYMGIPFFLALLENTTSLPGIGSYRKVDKFA